MSDGSVLALIAGVSVIIYLAIVVFMILAVWKVFTKAGKPGWACIVPIYNIIIMLEIAKKPTWWIILFIIPVVNFVIMIMLTHAISKSFGKDVGFTLGMIFLPIIFFPILGFGSATYIADAEESAAQV